MNNAPPNKKSLSASEVTMRCAIEHKGAVKIPDSFTSRSDAAGGIFSFHKNFLTRRSHKHFYQSARALRSSGPEMASRLLLHTDNFALRNNNCVPLFASFTTSGLQHLWKVVRPELRLGPHVYFFTFARAATN